MGATPGDDSVGGGELILIGLTPAEQVSPQIVGAKAYVLMRMADAGLPVPAGFVLPTSVCQAYHARHGSSGASSRSSSRTSSTSSDQPEVPMSQAPIAGERGGLDEATRALLDRGVRALEQATGRGFGSPRDPLLVSVRSGAPVSMPGMLDTLLDVGLTRTTLGGLLRSTGDPVFAWDSYRRLVESYDEIVAGCPREAIDAARQEALDRAGVPDIDELDVAGLAGLVDALEQLHRQHTGMDFPQDPLTQLRAAVEAVLRSWMHPRAVTYRQLAGLTGLAGTAVTVQVMVYGNRGLDSGAGVGFTRDPATGQATPYLDFLPDAQGEDVVSGRRAVPAPAVAMAGIPGLPAQLERVGRELERLFGDVQDFEFTVEAGRLWVLQARPAKRTPWAAVRIACDLVDEGLIDVDTALARLEQVDLDQVRRARLVAGGSDGGAVAPVPVPLMEGSPAGTGVAVGRLALDVSAARQLAGAGAPVVLARTEASTDDIAGLAVCAGLVTTVGSRTSHAAVVARQLGVAAVLGCAGLHCDQDRRRARFGSVELGEGEWVTVDADAGRVYGGQLDVTVERPERELARVRSWQAQRAQRIGAR